MISKIIRQTRSGVQVATEYIRKLVPNSLPETDLFEKFEQDFGRVKLIEPVAIHPVGRPKAQQKRGNEATIDTYEEQRISEDNEATLGSRTPRFPVPDVCRPIHC